MRVAILCDAQTALFELGCAVELFGLPRPEFPGWYEAEVVTFETGPIFATTGLQILPRQIATLSAYDMLVVPAWPVSKSCPGNLLAYELQRMAQRGCRIISFCSGSFLLAATGLLDGRKATTHWRYADLFREQFPAVHYVDNVLYVYEGAIGCSAGSAAGMDLALEVIRSDFGYVVANQVARRLVIAAHRDGGQAQFVETPLLEKPGRFAAALDWALSHLDHALSIDELASRAHMSRRSFDRRFRSSMQQAPKQWLTAQRLHLVRRLLESTDLPLETIALKAGFDCAATLRHHFRKSLQLSPTQFRAGFGRRPADVT